MGTAQQALAFARSLIDAPTVERPRGSNRVPGITDWAWFWDDAWCDMFVSRCLWEAGLDVVYAGCLASRHGYETGASGTWVGKPALIYVNAGDQILYGAGGGEHTGLVAVVDVFNNRVMTYEGNWGDAAVAQWRNWDDPYIFGVGRPNYDGVPAVVAPTPAAPAEYVAPADNGENPFTPLYVDGAIGPKTWGAVQWSLNDSSVPDMNGTTPIAVDGEPGPSTYSSLQLYIGATVDGDFGPESTKQLQRHVGAGDDGEWGPLTTKALQRALNGKTF